MCFSLSYSKKCHLLVCTYIHSSIPQDEYTCNRMGNIASCAPSMANGGGVVKVLFRDGSVEVFTRPVKAVELMLENPSHFVCDSSHLKVGRRIPGLTAAEELKRRHLYFLLPIEMLYSVLMKDQMDALTIKASRVVKPSGSKNIGKVFPILSKEFDGPKSGSEKRYSKQSSWKPALDTIIET